MLCCMPSNMIQTLSLQASKIFRILKILSILQLTFGILWMFFIPSEAFYMLIGALFLYLIVCGRNFCAAIFYIIFTLIDYFQTIYILSLFIYENQTIPHAKIALLLIFSLKMPVYTVNMYYSFLAYKELKALTLETQYGVAPQPWDYQPSNMFQPFTGPGHMIR